LPRDGSKNLRPPRSPEEAQELGRQGGIASGVARRKKKAIRDIVVDILSTPAPMSDAQRKKLAETLGVEEEDITIELVSVFAQAKKAVKGDLSAMVFLRDTAGEDPRVVRDEGDSDTLKRARELLGGVNHAID